MYKYNISYILNSAIEVSYNERTEINGKASRKDNNILVKTER